MACRWIELSDGTVVHLNVARSRAKPCEFCKIRPHSKLCDAPRGLTGTCDAKMCDVCAVAVGEDVDFCPHHAERMKAIEEEV